MITKFLDFWASLQTSLWFLPTLMAVISIFFAPVIIHLDESFLLDYRNIRTFFYAGGPDGARLLLSTIAGSMITVTGVIFSITMVALTLTTSQYGPRLLRNFMADRRNQVVMGFFLATCLYCLLVLSTIQENGNDIFVPRIAISLSLVLVVIDFGLLIFFFHHVSTSIHAENVIDSVYRNLEETIDILFPDDEGEQSALDGKNQAEKLDFDENALIVKGCKSGYFRAFDEETLISIAREHDVIIKVLYRPGNYVFARTALVSCHPRKKLDEETVDRIRDVFVLGNSRSPEHDIEFSINHLVEVAVRALSPGINDPNTAISCIDRLGAAICLINEKKTRSPYRYDEKEQLRLILEVVTYDGILDAAFNQIRQYGRGNVDIHIRLLEILHVISMTTKDQERLQAVRRHSSMVYRASREAIPEMDDRGDVDERYQALKTYLNREY